MKSAQALRQWQHGFVDPELGTRQTFRSILEAMDHPGQLVTISEDPNSPDDFNSACAAICLTLLDEDTQVWTDIVGPGNAISWLQYSCSGVVVTEPCMANFAIITKPAIMPALDYFRIGRYEYPERTTTMVVQVDDIHPSAIDKNSSKFGERAARLELEGIPDDFWDQWRQLSLVHPLGIDIFFTCDDVLTALPKINRRTV